MTNTLAFDIYGTLINTHGITDKLHPFVGDAAPVFSQFWRDKQLEYSFRRGLMQQYQPFSVCTRQALDFTCEYFNTDIAEENRQHLMEAYRTLPAFDDVTVALQKLQAAGFRLLAFSNGTSSAVKTLLSHANIDQYFIDIVSVDEIQTFKPDPAVYRHFLTRANSKASDTWLISSNPFDVIGALSSGLKSAWVQRSTQTPFDPWGMTPTTTVTDLQSLAQYLEQLHAS